MRNVQGREVGIRYLAALAHPDYRTLWTASLSAGAANWALIVARGWLVFELSGSSVWVGAVTFAAMFPRVVVSPFSGYLSDRFDRRYVLAGMFGLNLAQNLVLGLLVVTGAVEIWHLLVLSLVNGSARAAQMPTTQSMIPNVVPRHLLLNAIALNQATVQGSRLIGPAAIAPLLATTGPAWAFFLCAGFYGISFFQSVRLRTRSTGTIDQSVNFARNLSAGLFYVYRTPTLRALVILVLLHCGLTMSFESLLPVLSEQRLDAEGAGFSYLMMGVGGGALGAAIAMAGVRSETTKGRLYLYLGILSGLTPVLLAASSNMPLAMASAVGMGASQAGFMTLTHTMIQAITPDSVRGRVGGVYSIHIGGMMASINLLNGGLADIVPAPLVLGAGGLAFIAVMVLSLRYISLRQIYSKGLRPGAQPASAG